MKNRQSGFTLVEIAIVLVIIGLLLGGVLKGQELVNSAKVKNHISDIKAVPLFIYGYQDKYKALPGDDPAAATHVGAGATLAPTAATIGNGRIEGNFNSTTATDESLAFWQQVRLANIAAGSTDFSSAAAIAASVPRNTDGGRIGVQSTAPIANMTGSYFVCSDGILGKFAKQIDITMDDGNTTTGSLRVGANGYAGAALAAVPTAGAGAIADDATYTVCAAF
ncbi:MAG: prepilin-type N-terminal cleavage/methylation domain-containing protein [Rhodocyclales bacterium]|nr:prepilin-type N-terminal cleavage/methylation domain-containing protein [Rhodocyclales bacterium]